MSATGSRAVARRELLTASRRWTPFLVRLAYLGSLGLLLWQFVERLGWRNALSPSEFADLGRDLFQEFSALQFCLVSLSAALAGCDLVSSEARRGTLGLMALSPLSGREIAVGKWQSAMAQTGLLCFAGLPVLGVCVYLGGADVLELFSVTWMTAALAALCSATAVFFSCVAKRGWTALIWTALALGGWHFVLGIPIVLFAIAMRGGSEEIFVAAASLLPAAAALVSMPIGGPRDEFALAWILDGVFIAFFCAWVLRAAGRRIEARILQTEAPPEVPTAEEGLSPKLKSAKLGLFAPKGEVWDHDPLLWKERRIHGSGFVGADLRQMLLLMVPVTFYFALILDRRDVFYLPFWWAPVLLPLAIFNGVSLFAAEKEGNRWDLLLSTPLSPFQIIRAKLLGGFIGADLLVPFVPLVGLLAIFNADRAGDILVSTIVGGLFLAFAYVTAAAAGLHCSTVRGAVTLACFIVGAGALGPEFWREFVDSGARYLSRIANPGEVLDRMHSSAELFQGYLAYYTTAVAVVVGWIWIAFDRVAGRGRTA